MSLQHFRCRVPFQSTSDSLLGSFLSPSGSTSVLAVFGAPLDTSTSGSTFTPTSYWNGEPQTQPAGCLPQSQSTGNPQKWSPCACAARANLQNDRTEAERLGGESAATPLLPAVDSLTSAPNPALCSASRSVRVTVVQNATRAVSRDASKIHVCKLLA